MHVTVNTVLCLLPLIPLTQTRTANQLMKSTEGLYIPKFPCYLREPITLVLAHYSSPSWHKALLPGMIQRDCSHPQDEEKKKTCKSASSLLQPLWLSKVAVNIGAIWKCSTHPRWNIQCSMGVAVPPSASFWLSYSVVADVSHLSESAAEMLPTSSARAEMKY